MLPPAGRGLPDGTTEGSWLVFADETGFGDRLAARLRVRGREVAVAHAGERFLETEQGDFAIRPGGTADYGALLDRLAQRGIAPTRIVHLWSVGAAQDTGQEQERGFYSLFHLARALGDRRPVGARPPLHLGIVSTGVQRITGTDDLVPARATLLGPAITLPQEYPGITCAALDITLLPADSREGHQLIDLLLAELAAPADSVVAYRGMDRWLRTFEQLPLASPRGPLPLRQGGTYLITGGLGGMGLELAGFLARLTKGKLVLTGRSPFPERETWPALARGEGRLARIARRLLAFEAAGAEVWPVAADVTDAASMRRMLAEVRRRCGRIDGVIHAAGLAGGGMMQFRTFAAAAAVLAPKVQGTLLLTELLAEEPPDFLFLCSSLNALVGGPGQFDYTAANAFLDAFAQSRGGELPVVSINWDAWRDVGMAVRRHPAGKERSLEVTDLEPFAHPLLRERGMNGDGAGVFVGRLSPGETWVLDEHRLGGHPVVPGTAYLEMAGAAFRSMATTGGAIEFRDVQFVTPLHIGDGETRELQIVLSSNSDGFHHFSARSRDGGGWQEHVQGAVGTATNEERIQLDVPSFNGWEEEVLGEDYRENLKQAGLGPRWEVLKKVYRRDGEIVGLLELAPEFARDVEGFQLHPALLDAATSFAEHYVPGAEGSYYLPLSYKRLRMSGPLPLRFYSHARLRTQGMQAFETLCFDIAILDETGLERVRVEEFTLKRVDVAAILRGHAQRGGATPASKVEEMLESMDPERAVEAFRRILAGSSLRQIAVSVRPLPEVLEWARAITAERLAEAVRPAVGTGHARSDLETPYVAPRGELENGLAAIWSDVLGLDFVGAADDFFELGGHSLLGTQLMSRVRETFGVEVPLGKLFEAATVADFATVVAAQLADAGASGRDEIPRLSRGGDRVLSFAQALERVPHEGNLCLSAAQQRMWFAEQLQKDSWALNSTTPLRLRGLLDRAALDRAMNELVARHEALRTSFHLFAGEPVQVIGERGELPLPIVDLQALPGDRREAETQRLTLAEGRQPFDLTRAPLFRVRLLRLGPDDQLLIAALHHIITDEWSMKLLTRELSALYSAFHRGEGSPLLPLRIQYADYAVWQRRWLQGEASEREMAFWRRQLRPPLAGVQLATDRPRSAATTSRGAYHSSRLAPDLTDELRELAQKEIATPFMALLAIYGILLSQAGGQGDFVVLTDVANRANRDTESIIGYFVNLVALRMEISGGCTFRELLQRVRKMALDTLAHQAMPFDELMKRLRLEGSPGNSPFNVYFTLRDSIEQPDGSLELVKVDTNATAVAGRDAARDLGLYVHKADRAFVCIWHYKTDLFDPGTVADLADRFNALCRFVVTHPNASVDDFDLGSEGAQQGAEEHDGRQRRLLTRFRKMSPKPPETTT
ncbi:MAG TPA: SDR family NAD(P)-dependent oxidoreductase [Thermoanaerobaculia bacterium]|nr:SDR family NAD(P)-dependent oxidoreductase [Thermoanaerobaculia bacterium]